MVLVDTGTWYQVYLVPGPGTDSTTCREAQSAVQPVALLKVLIPGTGRACEKGKKTKKRRKYAPTQRYLSAMDAFEGLYKRV